MRLIDADKLVDMLYDNEFASLCPLDEVSGVIDACPTVDVEVVVRCEDCVRCGFCGEATNLEVMGFYGFCSRGKRKDAANEAGEHL